MKKKNVILKNLTPVSMSCVAFYCPAIYETKDDAYIIIGKLLREKAVLAKLKDAISSGDAAIKVPKKLLTGLKT